MIRKYPKPILCGDLAGASFYKNDYSFSVLLFESDCSITSSSVNLSFSANLTSSYLRNLLESGDATLYCKVQTNRHAEVFEYKINEIGSYSIDKNLLDRIDKIHITMMIVANKDILFNNKNELIDDFKEFDFNFKQRELLAISNTETLNYSLSGNPFINISMAISQEDKGLSFSSLDKEVIQIKVGKSLNEAYAKLNLDKDIKDIMNPFLAFTAILYSIEKAIFDDDKTYKTKDWFAILEQSFESNTYDSFEDFLESMRNNFDADVIFDVAQKIINNSLELRIRDVARRKK